MLWTYLELCLKEHLVFLIMHHVFVSVYATIFLTLWDKTFVVYVAMLEIGKLFSWQTWAMRETCEWIVDCFHELVPDMALEIPFEWMHFRRRYLFILVFLLFFIRVQQSYSTYA